MCDNALATFRTSRYISMCFAFGSDFMIGSITGKLLHLGLKDMWSDPRVEAAPNVDACTGRDLWARDMSIAAHTPKTLKGCQPRVPEFEGLLRKFALVSGGHCERQVHALYNSTMNRGRGWGRKGTRSILPAVTKYQGSSSDRLLRRYFMRPLNIPQLRWPRQAMEVQPRLQEDHRHI